jgi:cyclic dehypoxanthinyl futalosine synthase
MYVAHSLGMFTSATMMFGHIEGHADRIHHMRLVREWQDRALRDFGTGEVPADVASDPSIRKQGTGGHYTAFISWPFQPDNTALGRVKEWPVQGDTEAYGPGRSPATRWPGSTASGTKDMHPEFGRRLRFAGATDYLRTQATSRLFLDNIYSIGASWVTMGPHVGRWGCSIGANDMGSVMMEENVVSSAGRRTASTRRCCAA